MNNQSKPLYRMPAEFEEHEQTLISWPVQENMCYPEDYELVCANYYLPLIKALAQFEQVTVIVNPGEKAAVQAQLANAMKTTHPIEIRELAHNDAWLRDNGPTIVYRNHSDSVQADHLKQGLAAKDGERIALSWRFNAWGEKYPEWLLDDELAPKIAEQLNIPVEMVDVVMEGGSIHTDGQGTLLTTEECLLNVNRNPGLNREQITDCLEHYLGVSKIIWLPRGLAGDETDGHVDNIACFVEPGHVVIQLCEDPRDENYAITQRALEILHNTVDAQGRKLKVSTIMQPPAQYITDAETGAQSRLTLSYLNFYIVNDGIILPVFFQEKYDKMAIDKLTELFPNRQIVTIDGMSIIKEGGNVHCSTQQVPLKKI